MRASRSRSRIAPAQTRDLAPAARRAGRPLNITAEQAHWLTTAPRTGSAGGREAQIPIMFLTGGQTAEFGRIAERHPQLSLIIDHMGVSTATLRAGKMPEAVAQSAALREISKVVGQLDVGRAAVFSSEPYPWRR